MEPALCRATFHTMLETDISEAPDQRGTGMNRLIGVAALSLTATTVLHAQIRMRTGFSNPYNTCQSVTLGLRGGPAGITSFVRQLDPLSPEALAGLRPGDTIVVMNGI